MVLVSVANWTGVRAKTEFWTAVVDHNGQRVDSSVGDALLAALARGELEQGEQEASGTRDELLGQCLMQMRQRQDQERIRRQEENEALAESRRISLQETHDRKVRQIENAIQTLQREGNERMAELNRRQLENQDRLLRQRRDDLEEALTGALDVEHLAVCLADVV